MPALRVAVVARRFWPLMGEAERLLATLVSGFSQLDVETTVLTAQWEPHWPNELPLFGAKVVRLCHPQVPGWGILRFLWSLGSWLRNHRTEFDAVLVSSLQYESYIVQLALANMAIPIVLRAEQGGEEGDVAWQNNHRLGYRVRQSCQQADTVIAPHEEIASELLQAGYTSERLEIIANGVSLLPSRTFASKIIAREILAETHYDLKVDANTFVAIYVGKLACSAGLHDLIRAWRKIVELWPNARLWLLGEGPDRYDLYDRIRESHLQYHISMPGAFEDVADILPAADVAIFPGHCEGSEWSILECMSSGVPVIVSEIPAHTRIFEAEMHGLFTPIKNYVQLAESIARVFTLQEEAAARAKKAHAWVESTYTGSRMSEQHLALLERLLAKKRDRMKTATM